MLLDLKAQNLQTAQTPAETHNSPAERCKLPATQPRRPTMQFIGWMYDIARDQCPTYELLDEVCSRSLGAGYNAVCLYLEHRYAYPSAPWAAADGCLTPEAVKKLTAVYKPRGLRVIPFLNVLGHMEGFIRSEGGRRLSEGQTSHQEQICPSKKENVEFATRLVLDAMDAFDDEWVHLGGDETWQLGSCEQCKPRADKIGKAGIYGEHFAPLCKLVLEKGRRPAIWGDMLLQHPEAMDMLPKETVIFDWHYEEGPTPTSRKFRDKGFDVVCSPSLKMFDANWSAMDLSRKNIDDHASAVDGLGALGVCVTTWEPNYFAIFRSYLPLIYSAGRHLRHGAPWNEALLAESDAYYPRAAEILGRDIPSVASFLAQDRGATIRAYLAMRLNPFYLWVKWREEACSPVGDKVLMLCDEADAHLKANDPLRGMVELHRVAVLWVRGVEEAYRAYVAREFKTCREALRSARGALGSLRPHLEDSAKHGGARVDLDRLTLLQLKVDEVSKKVGAIAKSKNRAYLPAFEIVVDGGFVPNDTAAWRTGTGR
jgi:hypothetical protein